MSSYYTDRRKGQVDLVDPRRDRHRAKPPRHHSVYHELQVDLVVGERREVMHPNLRRKLPGKELGVQWSYPEGDKGPHVPQDRRLDAGGELGEMLVGEDHAQPILPKL